MSTAIENEERKPEWEVVQDRLDAFQALIRLRSDEWELHSWNIFIAMMGGGRVQPYPVEYVASVWHRRQP